jgi:hypothetical protein
MNVAGTTFGSLVMHSFPSTSADLHPTFFFIVCHFFVDSALEIPGQYRFDALDDKKCAAIGTMMPIGPKAAFLKNMGGCPEAMENGCDNGIPPECADYLVDLGAHWELRTTEQNVEYQMNATTGSGNDLVANNDDEYGASPTCRSDDDDILAGNEWSGAWSHSNPVEGEAGMYRFELSRTLTTASTATDAQMEAGNTYDFGIAYWDPFETEFGWTAAGHFLTGCSADWISLTLAAEVEAALVEDIVTCAAPGKLVCKSVTNPPFSTEAWTNGLLWRAESLPRFNPFSA